LSLGIRNLRSGAEPAPPAPALPGASRLAKLRAHSGVIGESVADALRLAGRGDPRLLGAPIWWGFDIAALWAAFHAFGAPPPLAVLVLGYFVGQLANTIPLPGSVSGGSVAVFVAFGMPLDLTLAAVLSYRALAVWTPVPFGALAIAGLRRTVQRWSAEDALAAGTVGLAPTVAACACSGSSTATRRRSAASSGSSRISVKVWSPATAST
jgi:hypothetical protein